MKKIVAVILAACVVLSATSCNFLIKNDEQQFDYPVTVGNLVIEKAPSNIAVLSENLADIVIACGYEGKLSARSDSCGQEILSPLPSVGTADSPDMGVISSLGIDLILADSCFDDETAEQLEKMGVSYLVMRSADDINSMSKLYSNVAASVAGGYTGKLQALKTFEEFRNALENIKSSVSDENVVSTVCYIYDVSDDECVVAYGHDFADQLFEYAGLTNIAAADDDGVIGIDTLLKGNPDTIFCDSGILKKISEHNDLKSLKAISKETIYEIPAKFFELQGASCIQITDFMAAKTHSSYVQVQEWPDELLIKQKENQPPKEKYEPPFEPEPDIYYMVGESYDAIMYIEERLAQLGYFSDEPDQDYTEETAEAVGRFQAANSIEVTGVADYTTLKILLSELAK